MASTAAQDEFHSLVDKAAAAENHTRAHPADERDFAHDAPRRDSNDSHDDDDDDEEAAHLARRINETMKMPLGSNSLVLPANTGAFANSRTGVKGVIADARAYEEARRSNGAWGRAKDAGGKVISKMDKRLSRGAFLQEKALADSERERDDSDVSGSGSGSDGDDFFERWRDQRRQELERESVTVRTRRTSPSQRRFGRFDEVDADGYLDAIEKVTAETVVVVFVYDHECPVSRAISAALRPLVAQYPTIHFVGVHYEEIEFDNAGVPAILAYKNCGDLFANLTYIIDQIPENSDLDSAALEGILRKNSVL